MPNLYSIFGLNSNVKLYLFSQVGDSNEYAQYKYNDVIGDYEHVQNVNSFFVESVRTSNTAYDACKNYALQTDYKVEDVIELIFGCVDKVHLEKGDILYRSYITLDYDRMVYNSDVLTFTEYNDIFVCVSANGEKIHYETCNYFNIGFSEIHSVVLAQHKFHLLIKESEEKIELLKSRINFLEEKGN